MSGRSTQNRARQIIGRIWPEYKRAPQRYGRLQRLEQELSEAIDAEVENRVKELVEHFVRPLPR